MGFTDAPAVHLPLLNSMLVAVVVPHAQMSFATTARTWMTSVLGVIAIRYLLTSFRYSADMVVIMLQ